ncbi:MAG: type II toxin-antitoxin system PemK/MazF family toxin [Microcystis aeruginosa Ma_MB_S_20031200_S102]|uniref:Type II toxin-antitoxin system PemK/MazF family toxin n=1 Tax=Microcystis aeruginosa Ma_MB_S_20031200_S102 TaxID=2486254 RepID=A0A552EVI1_MICAE|nr:MAG: type II toxin-antitoxin system PemK/MazF family toxin [Microcystis aeruginosa Ma_MB_S_20031200_S102D]TRU38472.1 MAG: type II toxin-antitoxin system PemK/MazF family toxin [Microcystis aeruginosa Ma_MB_S_20031200_S102]
MTIFQGEIYWIDLGEPQGSEPAYLRPCVVVQNDALNQSQIGFFGLSYAMDGGYKGWNPYIERHLEIFVNCF